MQPTTCLELTADVHVGIGLIANMIGDAAFGNLFRPNVIRTSRMRI
jgi:hypothetical protein